MSSAAAPPRGGRPVRFRWAARSAPIFRCRIFILPRITRLSPPMRRWSAMAASCCSTTRSTWPSRRASRWNSAPSNPAANARPAASARRAAWRSSTRSVAGIERDRNLQLLDDLCTVMTDGSLCAMGGLTPMPVRSAVKHFPEDFLRPVHAAAAGMRRARAMTPGQGNRFRNTGRADSAQLVTLDIDGQAVTVPAGMSIMRAAMELGDQGAESSAPPTRSSRSGRAASAWSKSRAARARPPPAPRRSPPA